MIPKFATDNQSFSTGAQRGSDDGKPRPDLASPFALERKARILAHGAKHYGDRNWEKGMPFSRVVASAERHLMAFKQGKTDEDHLAQLAFNVDAILHYQECIKLGSLPASLDDLPKYQTAATPIPAARPPIPSKLPPSPRDSMTAHLDRLGCPASIGKQIAGGTSFGETHPRHIQRWAYIAGPMRGHADFNFPSFDVVRDSLVAKGYAVISPADIDRAAGDADTTTDQRVFAFRDFWSLYFISQFNPDAEIVMLPGWMHSTGATAENSLAEWLGIARVGAGE